MHTDEQTDHYRTPAFCGALMKTINKYISIHLNMLSDRSTP